VSTHLEEERLDLKKEMKYLYDAPKDKVTEVDVPPINYLMVDGQGDPSTSPEYHQAVEALFSAAYGLKFAVKKLVGTDYSVMPLESLWWTKGDKPLVPLNKNEWFWTALIAQPSVVTKHLLDSVLEKAKKKNIAALARLRFEPLAEGRSVQILHIGPYSGEGPTITKLHQYVSEHSYVFSGKHHEIYLNTPERTAPEKLKTIIRQPVRQ